MKNNHFFQNDAEFLRFWPFIFHVDAIFHQFQSQTCGQAPRDQQGEGRRAFELPILCSVRTIQGMSCEPHDNGAHAPSFCSIYYGINERFALRKHRPNIVIDGPGSGRPFAGSASPSVELAPITTKSKSKKWQDKALFISQGTQTVKGPYFRFSEDCNALFYLPFKVQRNRFIQGPGDQNLQQLSSTIYKGEIPDWFKDRLLTYKGELPDRLKTTARGLL